MGTRASRKALGCGDASGQVETAQADSTCLRREDASEYKQKDGRKNKRIAGRHGALQKPTRRETPVATSGGRSENVGRIRKGSAVLFGAVSPAAVLWTACRETKKVVVGEEKGNAQQGKPGSKD
ncbi:hypothetical protein TRVL_03837 [Trypanosoma vivax]|nr:hypothetical protein TRVL_03837 [Trypanosoma vivax]